MIDWKEAQTLYDRLDEARGKLALATVKDPSLDRIQKKVYAAITDQMDALEAYVAPFRATPETGATTCVAIEPNGPPEVILSDFKGG